MPRTSSPGTRILRATRRAIRRLDHLRFAAPVSHVYNPLQYAWEAHAHYVERFAGAHRDALLLGMNPGPFGMAQTGVPFGEIAMVRDWMGIEADVGKPPVEHPKRPVLGFDCPRSEVSGRRLWGWAKNRYGSAEHFFARFYVHNYCPLAFMAESGRNITPDKLPAAEREALFAICDKLLRSVVEAVDPRVVIGVGAFAETRARAALDSRALRIGRIPHPSPASPLANRGWEEAVDTALARLGVAAPDHALAAGRARGRTGVC